MQNVLEANDRLAQENRDNLCKRGIRMYNLIGSPGAGKTTLLEMLLPVLKEQGIRAAVIEGDCQTSRDAERIAVLDIPVIQINTGNACHLDANLISKAIENLDLTTIDILFVENIGNMVCPAEFDLGETNKIAVISVAEGDDKPLKYPTLFHESNCAVLTKTDLIPYTNFRKDFFIQSIHEIHEGITLFEASLKDRKGIMALAMYLTKTEN